MSGDFGVSGESDDSVFLANLVILVNQVVLVDLVMVQYSSNVSVERACHELSEWFV